MNEEQIWILDFGSQYTQLITRKTRKLGYSCIILTVKQSRKLLEDGRKPGAIVLSGGPSSIFNDKEDYRFIFSAKVPTMGICYGMQLMASHFGGQVEKGEKSEYGKTVVQNSNSFTIPDCPEQINVWMSHSDHITVMPNSFETLLESQSNIIAAIKHCELPLLGLQFHPEVSHSEYGEEVLTYFYKHISKLEKDWNSECMLQRAESPVTKVSEDKILCAFSGGVDSLVAAFIAHKVVGENLYCFFVDTGLLRPQDYDHIKDLQKNTPLNIKVINAQESFLKSLEGVAEPEEKRKIIGHNFISVFEEQVKLFEIKHNIKFEYLLQGTLYPDIIESTSPHQEGGNSATIKSHHNVGGLPEKMRLKLIEPLSQLFKDEVRQIGLKLGLEKKWINRHPFPGPGIGIRVIGTLNAKAIEQVQKSDDILLQEMIQANLYNSMAQAFTVLLPVKTVGVKGDGRAYEEVICLRLVSSDDFMTATWSDVPRDFLEKVSNRITNEVSGITRVVYDITSKPPGTIEWE